MNLSVKRVVRQASLMRILIDRRLNASCVHPREIRRRRFFPLATRDHLLVPRRLPVFKC